MTQAPIDARIADYIRANRHRYTPEAIRAQLIEAGHDVIEIDRAWSELAATEPASSPGARFGIYVWVVFGIVGALIVLAMFTGFGVFGLPWLAAYAVLGGGAAWAMSRIRPNGLSGWIVLAVVAPVVLIAIGGGICLGTVFLVTQAIAP